MGRTTISFETKPLVTCVEFTKNLDRVCFPKEMWLSNEELQLLLDSKADATILSKDGVAIGQAITLPELAATQILEEADHDFLSSPDGVYSYSESILPAFQNSGYGALLLHEIALRMRQQGYRTISAHVRTRFGWNTKRTRALHVAETRFITDFWEDPREVVEYQRAHI